MSGQENHNWLVASSDFGGDPGDYETRLDAFLSEAASREPVGAGLRLGVAGVPTIFDDLYSFLEERGCRVVFNEVQRQFSMPENGTDWIDQYRHYTYPYAFSMRLDDIRAEVRRRSCDGLIHYVQSFCHPGDRGYPAPAARGGPGVDPPGRPAGADGRAHARARRGVLRDAGKGRAMSRRRRLDLSTYHLVQLGCAKNQVDGEVVAGLLSRAGMRPADDPRRRGADRRQHLRVRRARARGVDRRDPRRGGAQGDRPLPAAGGHGLPDADVRRAARRRATGGRPVSGEPASFTRSPSACATSPGKSRSGRATRGSHRTSTTRTSRGSRPARRSISRSPTAATTRAPTA